MSETAPHGPSGGSDWVATAMRQAVADHAAGRLSAAEANYRRVLGLQREHGGALHGLGVIAYQTGHMQEGVELLQRAVALRPDSTDSLNALGLSLRAVGRHGQAVEAHRRATQIAPSEPAGFTNLGLALRDSGQYELAEAACRHSLSLGRNDPLLHNNLGTVLMRAGRFDQAEAAFLEALRLDPNYIKAMNNLGTTRLWSGRPAEAVAEYDRALRVAPNYPEVHWHRAVALLTMGEWERGWAEYEWRWRCAEYRAKRYQFPKPAWDGSDVAGSIILLTPEQGLGDSIQFVRYARLLAARGARVMMVCQPELARLFEGTLGVERVIAANGPGDVGDLVFDVHLPLLSLPLRFGTTLNNVPADVPYLKVSDEARERWRVRLAEPAGAESARPMRVGLCWAGRPIPDPLRTCGLHALAPLAAVEGVRFISLQVGPPAAEATHAPAGMMVEDFSAELTDFAQTAALMANLDLVITIDSAVAHLAGALGVATWTLLRQCADWRWLIGRQDSPWYPTMRLFRQPTPGDWISVVETVAGELKRIVHGGQV